MMKKLILFVVIVTILWIAKLTKETTHLKVRKFWKKQGL